MIPIIIDSVDYTSVIIVDRLVETAEIQEGISRMVRQDGSDWFDIIGTRKNRTVELRRKQGVTRADWDAFYAVISAPVDYHQVTIGNKSFKAHITTVERELLDYIPGYPTDKELWGNSYIVSFEAVEPEVYA